MVTSYPQYDLPRDLEGYGEDSFDPQWPNDAKIAVSFMLNYEEGAERTIVNGDSQSEPYLWEKGASSGHRVGHRFVNAESEYGKLCNPSRKVILMRNVEYGSRVGGWRVLRLFKEFGWNFTTYAIAQALEKNPSYAKALVRDGHEIAAHGYRWLELWELSLQEDEENIIKALMSLEKTTGVFPQGVYFGRGTPNTKALFADVYKKLGKELLWNSEAYNDDVPYWIDLPAEKDLPDNEKKGMLIIPYCYDCNGT